MTQADLPVLIIDGSRFEDLAGFANEFSALLDDYTWHNSLDAFNDILRGGVGIPDDGFVLRWLDSERSRDALGRLTPVEYELIMTPVATQAA